MISNPERWPVEMINWNCSLKQFTVNPLKPRTVQFFGRNYIEKKSRRHYFIIDSNDIERLSNQIKSSLYLKMLHQFIQTKSQVPHSIHSTVAYIDDTH